MLTSRALLVPSVPTMLIDEQRGDFTEMIEALTAVGEQLAAEGPEVLVALSARWVSPGPFLADDSKRHGSVIDLPGFGVEPRYDCEGHPLVARAIVEQAQRAGLRAETARRGTDTGLSVPLHFLARSRTIPVVPVSVGEGSREEHRAWGEALRHALHARPERIAFVVGGALGFHQHAFNLRRELEETHALSAAVCDALARGRWSELETLDARLVAEAQPEAGLRHLDVLRGFLLGDLPGQVIEQEFTPGIATVLAEFPLATEAV